MVIVIANNDSQSTTKMIVSEVSDSMVDLVSDDS